MSASKVQFRGPKPERGFTTLQLLDLAAKIINNINWATYKKKAPKLYETLQKSFRIPLPPKTQTNIVGKLTAGEYKWFNGGQGAAAYRAITAEGKQIEGQRANILQFVRQYAAQFLGTQEYWPSGTGGLPTARGPAKASSLNKVLMTTGVRYVDLEGKTRQPATFNERINSVFDVLSITESNEPMDYVKPVGTGGFGQLQNPSVADAKEKVAASNGFRAVSLAKFLSSKAGLSAERAKTMEQAEATNTFRNVILPYFSDKADVSQKKYEIEMMASDPAGLHTRFVNATAAVGGPEVMSKIIWAIAGASGIAVLLQGYSIITPRVDDGTKNGKKGFTWNPTLFENFITEQQAAAGINNADIFSKYVYDLMFAAYYNRGGAGDTETVASSARRPRGIIGPDDKSVKSLNLNAPKKVGTFINNARTGTYSMDALKTGAMALGVTGIEGALVHDAVIAMTVDHIVRAYADQVNANNTDYVIAAGKALGLKSTQLTKEGVLRKLDAMYGNFSTGDCVKDYTKPELKRIARNHQISTDLIKSKDVGCMVLAQSNIQPKSSNRVQDMRKENEAVYVPKVSSGRKATGAQAVDLNQLLRAAPAMSAGTREAFQQFGTQRFSPSSRPFSGSATVVPPRQSPARLGSPRQTVPLATGQWQGAPAGQWQSVPVRQFAQGTTNSQFNLGAEQKGTASTTSLTNQPKPTSSEKSDDLLRQLMEGSGQ